VSWVGFVSGRAISFPSVYYDSEEKPEERQYNLPARHEEETSMPKLTVEGVGEVDIPQGKRLVLALEDEAKVDQLHACGGNARCTTCRVEFVSGEPEQMTQAEKAVLAARGLTGVRLSCQILCDHDMTVKAISRLAGSGRKDAGPRPADDIQPQPVQLVPK
jgi:ferredoxin